jgi:hypothetical protein
VGNLPGAENAARSGEFGRTSLLTSYQPSGPDAIVPTDLPPKFENDASFTAHGAPTRDQRSWGVVIADEPAQDGPGRKGRVAAYVRTDAVADLGPVIAALAAACSPRDDA